MATTRFSTRWESPRPWSLLASSWGWHHPCGVEYPQGAHPSPMSWGCASHACRRYIWDLPSKFCQIRGSLSLQWSSWKWKDLFHGSGPLPEPSRRYQPCILAAVSTVIFWTVNGCRYLLVSVVSVHLVVRCFMICHVQSEPRMYFLMVLFITTCVILCCGQAKGCISWMLNLCVLLVMVNLSCSLL